MKCKYSKCTFSDDCMILDITGKEPKSFDSCSYSKKQKDLEPSKETKKEK